MIIVEAAKNPIKIDNINQVLFKDDFNEYLDKYEKALEDVFATIKAKKPLEKNQLAIFTKIVNLVCSTIVQIHLLESMYGGRYEEPYIGYVIAQLKGSIREVSYYISNTDKDNIKEWSNILSKAKSKLESKDMKIIDFITNKELASDYYALINQIGASIKHL